VSTTSLQTLIPSLCPRSLQQATNPQTRKLAVKTVALVTANIIPLGLLPIHQGWYSFAFAVK
jgi:hypothetical protein